MTIHKIHNNRITFQDGGRFYFNPTTGQYVPSVTTITDYFPKSKQFLKWLMENGMQSESIRDDAGNDGSIVHQLSELYDAGVEISLLNENGDPRYTQKQWAMLLRYAEFIEDVAPAILNTEFQVFTNTYAGTVDRLVTIDGETFVLDIKTSKSVHPSHWAQTAAYARALEGQGVRVDGIAILHLQASTRTKKEWQGKGWRLEAKYDIAYYYRLFECCYELYSALDEEQQPRLNEMPLTVKKAQL